MVLLAVILDLAFLLVAFGGRTALQWSRHRDTGWRLGRRVGPAELVARSLMVGAAGLLAVALVVDADGSDRAPSTAALGVAVAVAAIGLVVVAQLQMGDSWRIGVDHGERTDLVTAGVYRWIRNPIYTGMVAFVVGQLLLVPGLAGAVAVVAMAVGVEIQVRSVEEPYLRATHGLGFTRWASGPGRFVPRIGRFDPRADRTAAGHG